MILNYLKIAWRNLRSNKIFSFINIIGLVDRFATGLVGDARVAAGLCVPGFDRVVAFSGCGVTGGGYCVGDYFFSGDPVCAGESGEES